MENEEGFSIISTEVIDFVKSANKYSFDFVILK